VAVDGGFSYRGVLSRGRDGGGGSVGRKEMGLGFSVVQLISGTEEQVTVRRRATALLSLPETARRRRRRAKSVRCRLLCLVCMLGWLGLLGEKEREAAGLLGGLQRVLGWPAC
jgi:hypothetical protein